MNWIFFIDTFPNELNFYDSLDFCVLLSVVEFMYTGNLEVQHDDVDLDTTDLHKEQVILALLEAHTFLQVREKYFMTDQDPLLRGINL